MFRALLIKELREIWWLGIVPLGFMIYAIAQDSSYNFWHSVGPRLLERWERMPFADATLTHSTLQWGCILAAAVGLWQTFRESQSRTWHFLLHRPVDRQVVLRSKVLAAGLIYFLAIVVPILGLTIWAATPGTHASPFHWLLPIPAWYAVTAGTGLYLAAIFAGLRRGHLLGSRWWPLVAASAVFGIVAAYTPRELIAPLWIVLLVWDALLAAAIYTELKATDFN